MIGKLKCVDCDGTGELTGVFPVYAEGHSGPPVVEIGCDRCEGSGQMPAEMLLWIRRGERIAQYREDELKMGPREAAEFWGLRPSELMNMESGKRDNSEFFARLGLAE